MSIEFNTVGEEAYVMKVGRNDPCPCGSGKKFKKCCADKDSVAQPVVSRSAGPVEDLVDRGYRGRTSEAMCEPWWQAWQALRVRVTPSMMTMTAAQSILGRPHLFFNWCQDFEMELGNAALDSERWAKIGVEFFREWMALFPDEDDHTQMNFQRTLGNCLLRAGESQEGLRVLEQMTERWPREPWGYFELINAHAALRDRMHPLPRDLDLARGWLEKARANVPVNGENREVLEEAAGLVQEAEGAEA